jgi:pimeloyl-ACP methyl ester carboxylesterase
MKIVKYIIVLILFFVATESKSQDCDCVYPLLFVHGWAGGETSWLNFSNEIDAFGDGIIIPNNENGSGTVFYAHLNYNHNSTAIWGQDGNPDFPSYQDDDVIVHDQFYNAPDILSNKCSYAISFQTQKTIVNRQLIFENMAQWDDENYITEPDNQSTSNQASAYKQGYALGKAIEKVLEVTGKDKVILVAHSMGGLAVREYLQRQSISGFKDWWVDGNSSDGHKVAKVLTVGTPHRGSNVGNSLLNIIEYSDALGSIGLDLKSEAVRDLRYFYNTDNNVEGVQNNGAFLFGSSEGLVLNNPDFYNKDVDANGTELESIEGINISGIANGSVPWDGTYDNPNSPLPIDIKYTYYVSDKSDLLDLKISSDFLNYAFPDWLTWISSTINFTPSDGIVPADRQWIYINGNGTTSDFESGNSIPVPLVDYSSPNSYSYVLSDRITPAYGVSHLDFPVQLPLGTITPLGTYLGASNYETNDFDNLFRGIDEADFPEFAYEVEIDKNYGGYSQKRSDLVATNSNISVNSSSSEENNIDSDWYKFNTLGSNSFQIRLTKQVNQQFIVDLIDQVNLGSYTNSVNTISSITSDANSPLVELSTGELQEGEYYLRITSVVDNSGEQEYSFIIDSSDEEPSVGPCYSVIYADYTYECGGNDLSLTVGSQWNYNGRFCGSNDPTGGGGNGGFGGGFGGGPGNPSGSGTTTVNSDSNVPVVNENDECQECVKNIQALNALILSRQNSNGN